MQIHIKDSSFRASQLEKCVVAICSMWPGNPGDPDLEVTLSFRHGSCGPAWNCRIQNTAFCGSALRSGPCPSPWKAMCGAIRSNPKQAEMWGIRLEDKPYL